MPASADVSAGDDALASEYNNLRQDTLHDTLSHGHTGVGEDAKLIELDGLAQEVKDTLGSPASIQRFKTNANLLLTVAAAVQKVVVNQTITAVDLAKTYVVMAGMEQTLLSAIPVRWDQVSVRARLTSSTNVEIEVTVVHGGQAANKSVDFETEYQVVEWP